MVEARAETLFLMVAGIAIVGLFWTMTGLQGNSTGNLAYPGASYYYTPGQSDSNFFEMQRQGERLTNYKLCRQQCYSNRDSRFSPDRDYVRNCLAECARIANAQGTYSGLKGLV